MPTIPGAPAILQQHPDGLRAETREKGAGIPLRVGLVSLGCPKNLVDSEKMLGRLVAAGCEVAADPEDADIILVNTCGFIADARRESINTILEMGRHAARGKRLVVAGCLVERYREELRRELPEVDVFLGVTGQESIAELLGLDPPPACTAAPAPRALTGSPYTAYLKISEGCNLTCSFCAIPSIRGPQRSRPVDDLIAEADQLAEQGITELILVAQDSTGYGRDLADPSGLPALVRRLASLRVFRWIRVNYLYPNHVTNELLEAIAGEPSVCRYIDIPLQHSDAEVLASMRRGGGGESHLRLLERIRSAVPGAFLRSAFIVGYPAETREAFAGLLNFLEEARLDHVGAFTYSREENTPAWDLGDPVPAREKSRRRSALMIAQQRIGRDVKQGRIGEVHEALVEGVSKKNYVCRIPGQAPDIDGTTLLPFRAAEGLSPGDYVRLRLSACSAYDFRAEGVSHG